MLANSLEDIVDIDKIGDISSMDMNSLMELAKTERKLPANGDIKKVLVLAIDIQNDFMENGSLPVAGSHKDVENLIKFIYSNAGSITSIIASLDTHTAYQIFHPCWWTNSSGDNPKPFTFISSKDIESGIWIPVRHKEHSIRYVKYLEENSRKSLIIWPYHCMLGTTGHCLEAQFSKMAYYHSMVRDSNFEIIVKGTSPTSEMYGIFRPEYDEGFEFETTLLDKLAGYDMVIIGGEAKSHCALESLSQICEYYKDSRNVTERIYLLEDCTSSISGFEQDTEAALLKMEEIYGIKRVKSTELVI